MGRASCVVRLASWVVRGASCVVGRDGRVRLASFAGGRLLRHALPISLLILRKKNPTVLQSMRRAWCVVRRELRASPASYVFLHLKVHT